MPPPKKKKKLKVKKEKGPAWVPWEPHMIAEANIYVEQGNREFYTAENLKIRRDLRHHPMVKGRRDGPRGLQS